MIYSLLIQSSPDNLSISTSALAFAKALLQRNHSIYRLFFYGEGVLLTTGVAVMPQGEPDIYANWREFIEQHKLDAVVCIAAAAKRGILNSTESERHQKSAATLAEVYELSGLGQLIDATVHSDKLITFG
jgi:tRNA 2-thiouridine synthesizing protein D